MTPVYGIGVPLVPLEELMLNSSSEYFTPEACTSSILESMQYSYL